MISDMVFIISVNAATLGFSKGSTVIPIDDFAEAAVAISMLSSAVGVAVVAWMYSLHFKMDGETFRVSGLYPPSTPWWLIIFMCSCALETP